MILLLVGTVLVTLAIVGSGLLAVMANRISEESQTEAASAAREIAFRVETFLENIEARVVLAGELFRNLPRFAIGEILDGARSPSLDAIYVINEDGRVAGASIVGSSEARSEEMRGTDLSAYPIFRTAAQSAEPIWSEKHLSAITGAVTLGVAAPISRGGGVVIAELSLEELLEISNISRSYGDLEFWIIDRKGEVVVDTDPRTQEQINLGNRPIVRAGFSGGPLPETMSFFGKTYHVSAAFSEKLGWLFVARIPAGWQNPRFREVTGVVLVLVIGSVIVGLSMAPLWAMGIVRPLRTVAERAHQIARGERPSGWPKSGIVEFNKLSSDLETMGNAIARREEQLHQINEELESRVERRTEELKRSNQELSVALSTVERAKDELVQSEKLAALGRLVAGVSHELNTPLGNGLMAITALSDKLKRFEDNITDGLRRSDLDAFIKAAHTGTQIAELNLARATRLIGTLKQISADRTASRRRHFHLADIVDEVLLTLSPTLRPRPITVDSQIAKDISLDSYPGELGQVLTNLIDNCIQHAFKAQDSGTIEIIADTGEPGFVSLELRDDGVGMSREVARRVFEPFYSTSLGIGGSGLGLFITHNAITNVLGGTVKLDSKIGVGTRFLIRIPLVAPKSGDQV